jgi:hypothetical protein
MDCFLENSLMKKHFEEEIYFSKSERSKRKFLFTEIRKETGKREKMNALKEKINFLKSSLSINNTSFLEYSFN